MIGQAKAPSGNARHDPDTALAALALVSQHTSLQLRDVTAELCRTGHLPPERYLRWTSYLARGMVSDGEKAQP